MQLFYLSTWLTVLLFCVLWFLFQAGAAFICFHLPDAAFAHNTPLYRTRSWEQEGQFYEKVFKIKKWKHLLPDGGAFFKGGYAKKHIHTFTSANLQRFLLESRRAELTHWLAIFPFWVFGFFAPFYIVWVMLAYALAVNLPCIITQRYNRPRISRLLQRRHEAQVNAAQPV